MSTWTAEFYEEADGRRPVEAWIGGLGEVEFEALATAIEEILEKDGIVLARTPGLPVAFRSDANLLRSLADGSN